MWSHFCRIALRAEPNFGPFFLVTSKKVSQKPHKKRIPVFRIAHFLKKKAWYLAFLAKVHETNLFLFFFLALSHGMVQLL